MSEEQYKDGEASSQLKLVGPHQDSAVELISADKFFDRNVVPFLGKMSRMMIAKSVPSHPPVLDVPSRMVPELRRLLSSSAAMVPAANARGGKMKVCLIESYSCHQLIAKPADDVSPDEFDLGETFYFYPEDFGGGGNENPFEGKGFLRIAKIIEKGKGRDSIEAQNINRVIILIKSLLYDVEVGENERAHFARELSELRMEIGDAAKAIIKDFLRDYIDGDGWVEVTKGDLTGVERVGLVNETPAYYQAMARLKVGKYDLRKLG